EIGKIPLLAGLGGLDELLRRDPGLFRGQHDRGAVGVVGAHEVHLASGHAPRPDPDVGLDVADQMADVEMAVAVGPGAGDDRGAGHVDWRCGEGGLSHAAPAQAGARRLPSRRTVTRRGGAAVVRYWRIQTCDLQMKATQPDTLSLLPPSISSIFDLYTLPSSGLRMVPPAYPSPLRFIPRMISMPVIGLPLRSSLHSSQVGFGLLGLSSSTMRPLRMPLASWRISTIDLACPVSSSMVFQRPVAGSAAMQESDSNSAAAPVRTCVHDRNIALSPVFPMVATVRKRTPGQSRNRSAGATPAAGSRPGSVAAGPGQSPPPPQSLRR